MEDYDVVVKPRVHGIWNLLRTLQSTDNVKGLDFFVNLSSTASFVGNMGQSPYAASGTFMAALAQYSGAANIPFTTIDLPIVRGIGYLSDEKKREQFTSRLGSDTVGATDIRGLVAAAIRKEMRTCDGHCVVGMNNVKTAPATEQPFWVKDKKLSHLLRLSTLARAAAETDTKPSNTEISPAMAIRQCRDREGAEAVVVTALAQKFSSILMRPVEELDVAAPISVYGLDSLVAIEIRNWITRELEANLQILEILTSSSVPALAELILKKSGVLTPDAKTCWGFDLSQ